MRGHRLTEETLLRNRRLKDNETIEMLSQALAEMCQQMGKNEDELMNIFIQALPAQPYQTTIMAANPKTLTETLQIAKGVEAMNLQPERRRRGGHSDMYTMISEMSLTDDIVNHKEETRAQLEAQATRMAAMESRLKEALSGKSQSIGNGNQEQGSKPRNTRDGETTPVPPQYSGTPRGPASRSGTQRFQRQGPRGQGGQGYGNQGHGGQFYGNQGFGNQGYGNQNYGNQGYGWNQNYGGYRSPGPRMAPYGGQFGGQNRMPNPNYRARCYQCGDPNHIVRNCPQIQQLQAAAARSDSSQDYSNYIHVPLDQFKQLLALDKERKENPK